MKRLVLKPNGWPCQLKDCPPGLFVHTYRDLGFRSEYTEDGEPLAYNGAGERFVDFDAEVQPVVAE